MALLTLALVDLAIAASLLTLDSYPASVRHNYAGQAQIMPLNAWAFLWLSVAALMIVQAFSRHDKAAFVVSAGVKLLWVCGYGLGFAYLDVTRAWFSATTYLAFAALLLLISGWLENERAPRVGEWP